PDGPLHLDGIPGRIPSQHPHAARGRLGEAQQHEDGGGFARSVGPEKAEHFPFVDGQVQTRDRGVATVPLGQAARLDDRAALPAGGGQGRVRGRTLVLHVNHRGSSPHRRPYTRKVPSRPARAAATTPTPTDRKTRLNSSHVKISYAVFCLK